ncbi:SPOR domain-containing protein [Erythrobacter mangrovi]|uniref:SPOR domain-containing protein n=1 Tax=Erythrobacter mangrovi TaxID=2739433 RepID=UPI001F44A9A0|nr:SPOR domain-containing protein [Erythrobacter mangrovi]
MPAQADVKAGVDAWTRGEYATAVREWVEPAQQGDPDAQFNLAQAYRLGRGVDPDPNQAKALYERAAAQGHLRAADNLGLMLFQEGQHELAMPYIEAGASRGDPRSQYILGIAHFNGDLAEKDWQRAYALLTLANSTGLPQAKSAIQQMDQYISLEDRQAAQLLATSIKAQAEAARARELAAVDLALGTEGVTGGAAPAPSAAPVSYPPRQVVSPLGAGADYTLPARSQPVIVARAEPARAQAATPQPAISAPPDTVVPAASPVSRTPPSSGPWKLQLGAFGVPSNADRLWRQLAGRSELADREKLKIVAGSLTRLLAGGFASRADAASACASLKRAGHECLVTLR